MFKMMKVIKRFIEFIKKFIEQQSLIFETQAALINQQAEKMKLIEQQKTLLDTQTVLINQQTEHLNHIVALINTQDLKISQIGSKFKNMELQWDQGISESQLIKLIPRMRRNLLPNDSSAVQKTLMTMWRTNSKSKLGYKDLLESGFRVFSQNDEDGMLLKIFSHIDPINKYVVEIGSNSSDSDVGIPENLSTNLIVNHGWHGAIFEIDQTECERMRYFFARDFATKHFHVTTNGKHDYFSPLIIQNEITSVNINEVLNSIVNENEPDLMVIDIDGGDYSVVRNMNAIRPRVFVVEFERRFRDKYSVVQFDSSEFSKRWPQSGAASLPAWEKLLNDRGYTLCAIGTCGFNAFFVRSDIASEKFTPLTSREAFEVHPILSKIPEDFWLSPDETWQQA